MVQFSLFFCPPSPPPVIFSFPSLVLYFPPFQIALKITNGDHQDGSAGKVFAMQAGHHEFDPQNLRKG